MVVQVLCLVEEDGGREESLEEKGLERRYVKLIGVAT